jgi:MFS family permease
VHHTSLAVATVVGGALVVGALGGFAVAAVRARRTAPRRTLLLGALVLAVSGLAMALAPNVPLVAAAALGSGAVSAGFWNTLHTTTLQLRPARAGTVKAVVSTIEFAGFPLPIAIGWVADRAGLRAAMLVFAAIAAALAPLVALGPTWRPDPVFEDSPAPV